MKHYIGLDAHSKTSTFVVIDTKGQEVTSQRLATGESEILRFVRSIKGVKALTFEESHLSKWLYALLKPEVEELVVCNPTFISRRSGPKDDYPDGLHLAQQLRGGFLTPVFHQDNFFSELRSLVSAYDDLNTDIIRLKNRYKAIFRAEAHNTKGAAFYRHSSHIGKLGREMDRFVARGVFEQIDTLEELKKEYQERFDEYKKEHVEIRALSTIPGIASVRACIIAAIVCSPERFADKFKFWSYCMLVKYDNRSDDQSYGKERTGGNRLLKATFMGAAEAVLLGKSKLKNYYNRMREKGLDHWAAKKNLARKIAGISLALMKKKGSYQDELIVVDEKKS